MENLQSLKCDRVRKPFPTQVPTLSIQVLEWSVLGRPGGLAARARLCFHWGRGFLHVLVTLNIIWEDDFFQY